MPDVHQTDWAVKEDGDELAWKEEETLWRLLLELRTIRGSEADSPGMADSPSLRGGPSGNDSLDFDRKGRKNHPR